MAAMGVKSLKQKKRFIVDGLARCVELGLTAVQTNDEGCLQVGGIIYQSSCIFSRWLGDGRTLSSSL